VTDENQNVASLKEAYRLWYDTKAGSVDHWLNLMTDDVKFRFLAEGAKTMEFTRTSTCKDEVKRYFAGLTGDWEMVYYRIDEYIAKATAWSHWARSPSKINTPAKSLKRQRPTSTNFATVKSANSSSFMTRLRR
jgi:hypothetical protein